MHIRTALLVLAFPLAASAQGSTLPPLVEFAKFAEFEDVTISPDGEYLAAKIRIDGADALGMIRLSDMKLAATMKLSEGRTVYDYSWVGPDRVAAKVGVPWGPLVQPKYFGEIMAKSADVSKLDYVVGYEKLVATDTRVQRREPVNGWSTLIDSQLMDPKRTLIKVDLWSTSRFGGHSTVYEVNTFTGIRKKITSAPFAGSSYYLADPQGRVRYVAGRDVQLRAQTWFRSGDDENWVKVNTDALADAEIWPFAFSADGDKAYLSSNEGGDRHCLVEHTLSNGERRSLACDPVASLDNVIFSFDGKNRPIAAVFNAQKPSVVPLDPADPDAKLLAAILRGFPGLVVSPVSQTRDGRLVVLHAYSDRSPGDYYLFDTRTKKAQHLLRSHGWIDAGRQAETLPLKFKARDGQELHAYLTVPNGRKAENLPLVVMPHGGPFGIRDEWEWDADAQALASRGYAVLKVNFRGSAGYGEAFREAARRKWGTLMIDDITDATRWVVAQGHADGQRLCIFGGSYGGYAALMSAVREPELYRCAIGYAGTFNLVDLSNREGDTKYTESVAGENYFAEWVGGSKEELLAQSPDQYLDRLKAAVMLIHGKEDKITPYEGAVAFRKALEKRDIKVEWLVKAVEGHGFYKVENRVEVYEKVLEFLDRHIGATAPSAATAVKP